MFESGVCWQNFVFTIIVLFLKTFFYFFILLKDNHNFYFPFPVLTEDHSFALSLI